MRKEGIKDKYNEYEDVELSVSKHWVTLGKKAGYFITILWRYKNSKLLDRYSGHIEDKLEKMFGVIPEEYRKEIASKFDAKICDDMLYFDTPEEAEEALGYLNSILIN